MTKNISNTLDIEKVTSALAKRLPDRKGPWRYEKTSFGQSNPTFILSGKNCKLVLRKKPSGNLLKSAHMIEREFKVMSALKFTDLPVPEMYFLCEDESEIGAPYFVMEYVEGHSFLDPRIPGLNIDCRKKVYQENIKGLAQLHKICPKKVDLSSFGKSGNYFLRQFSRWSVQYENSKTEFIEPLENLIKWLEQNLPTDQEDSTTIVHGDWRIDNLLFDKNNFELVGVFDWELSTLGDPKADLATQIMQWSMNVGEESRGLNGVNRKEMGIPEDKEFIDKYSKFLNLSQAPNLEFAIPFCYFRMAAILQGVKKRALDGNASNPTHALKMGKYIKEYAIKGLESISRNFK